MLWRDTADTLFDLRFCIKWLLVFLSGFFLLFVFFLLSYVRTSSQHSYNNIYCHSNDSTSQRIINSLIRDRALSVILPDQFHIYSNFMEWETMLEHIARMKKKEIK